MTHDTHNVEARTAAMAAVALVLLAAVSCGGLFATDIGTIQKDPGAFDGRSVTVAGEVTSSVNLAVLRFFKVKDATGTITVVTDGSLPKQGEKVRVTGRVEQAFAIGDTHVVVIVEDERPRS